MNSQPFFDIDENDRVTKAFFIPKRFKRQFQVEPGKSPKKILLESILESKKGLGNFREIKSGDWQFKFAVIRHNEYLRIQLDLSPNKKNITPVNRYQLLVEAASDVIFEIDVKGYFTYMNPTALALSGYQEKDIVGHHFTKLIREDWRERTVNFYWQQVADTVQLTYYEFPVFNANKREIWIGQKVQLMEDETGIIGLMAIGRDITEKKYADEALRRSEEKYRGIIQKLEAGLMEVDLDENILYVNQAMSDMMGYSEKELLNMSAKEFVLDPESREIIDKEHEKRDEGDGSVYEVKLRHKNGSLIWVIISGAPLFSPSGERTGSIGLHLDITDRKREEEELEFTKNRLDKYKRGLELINEITSNTELSFQEQLSEGLTAAAGYLELPLAILSRIVEDDYEVVDYHLNNDDGSLSKGQKFNFKETYCEIVYAQESYVAIDHFSKSEHAKHPCFKIFNLETYVGAPYYVNGEKRGTINFSSPDPRTNTFDSYDTEFIELLARWIGSLVQHMETSEELNTERESLRIRNEELFQQRNFLNAINQFVTKLLDKDDLEELSWEIAENVIKTFGFEDCVIYLLDEKEEYLNQVAVYGPKMGENRKILNPMKLRVGEGIVGMVAQTGKAELISDTSKDDRYILDDEPRLSELSVPIEADGKIIGVIDSEHTKKDFFTDEHLTTLQTIANLAANRLKIGIAKQRQKEAEEELRDSEQKLRTVISSALDGVISIDSEGIVTEWNRQCEVMFGFKKEEAIGRPLTDTIIPEQHRKAHKKGMKHYHRTGEGPVLGQKIEITALKKDGTEFPIELAIVPIVTKGIHSFTAFVNDITIQKQVQAETEKALAKEKELNELKSRFVAMTSHEFRTPLTTIKQNIDLVSFKIAQEMPDSHGDYIKFLDRIESEINRVTLLMNDILTLGRIESGGIEIHKTTVDFKEFVEDMIQMRTESRADGRKIKFKVQGVPQPVSMDEQLFGHILTNLISNAFKYSAGEQDPELTLDYSELRKVKLSVKDYGIGIPKKDQKGLFQSFYRATNVKNIQGSGLGLSIVKEFVEMHGGSINVDSQKNSGSTFTIDIPYK